MCTMNHRTLAMCQHVVLDVLHGLLHFIITVLGSREETKDPEGKGLTQYHTNSRVQTQASGSKAGL